MLNKPQKQRGCCQINKIIHDQCFSVIITIIIKIVVNLRMPMNGEFFPTYPWIIHELSTNHPLTIHQTSYYCWLYNVIQSCHVFSHINAKRTPGKTSWISHVFSHHSHHWHLAGDVIWKAMKLHQRCDAQLAAGPGSLRILWCTYGSNNIYI